MEKVTVKAEGFRSIKEFIEFCYVVGSHGTAKLLAKGYGVEDYFSEYIKASYQCQNINRNRVIFISSMSLKNTC